MHCDVDLRSRRMWAASYRLTRLEMNENSEYLESFCTGHARVRAERGGNGGDGAVADAPVLGRRCCCGCAAYYLQLMGEGLLMVVSHDYSSSL